jgi:hypothetical protein
MHQQEVEIAYICHRQEPASALIQPICYTYEQTSWYPNNELKLRALNLLKNEERIYLASSIYIWKIDFLENGAVTRFIEYTREGNGSENIERVIRSLPGAVADSTDKSVRPVSD